MVFFDYTAPMNEKVTLKHWIIVALAIVFTLIFGDWRTAHAADTGACYNIQDADARAYCIAKARGESSQCYNVQRADLRSQCLAEVRK